MLGCIFTTYFVDRNTGYRGAGIDWAGGQPDSGSCHFLPVQKQRSRLVRHLHPLLGYLSRGRLVAVHWFKEGACWLSDPTSGFSSESASPTVSRRTLKCYMV